MRATIEITHCDLCGRQDDECQRIDYPVVFETDQTDRRSCEPYIYCKSIDVCPACQRRILMVRATGAMGRNKYRVVEL